MIYRNGVFLRKKKTITGGVIITFSLLTDFVGKKGSLGLFRQLERRPNLNWFNIHIISRCVQQKKILGWQVQKKCGLIQWRIQGRAQGRGPPLFLVQTEAQRAKKIFLGDPPPPYLRVWMTGPPLISRSGSGTVVHINLNLLNTCY